MADHGSLDPSLFRPRANGLQETERDDDKAEPYTVIDYTVRIFPYSTAIVIAIIAAMKSDHAASIINMSIDYFGIRELVEGLTILQWIAVIFVGGFFIILLVYVWSTLAARRAAAVRAAGIEATERRALMNLYESTGGPEHQWIDRTRWGSNEPIWRWRGVHIDPRSGRVCKLILPSNGLTGNKE